MWLAEIDQIDTRLAALDRPTLERYLADLAIDPRALRARSRDISSLGPFQTRSAATERVHGLPANAGFYPTTSPNQRSACLGRRSST